MTEDSTHVAMNDLTLREAAEELAACKEGPGEGPCSGCLEQLDGAIERDRARPDVPDAKTLVGYGRAQLLALLEKLR
jgi:hypothetical protein